MNAFKFGLLALAVGGAFGIGQWQGGLQRSTANFRFLKMSSDLMHEKNAGAVNHLALRSYCEGTYPSAFSELHDDLCWPSLVTVFDKKGALIASFPFSPNRIGPALDRAFKFAAIVGGSDARVVTPPGSYFIDQTIAVQKQP